MKRIHPLLKILAFSLAGFSLFANVGTGIRAQEINIEPAQFFENGEKIEPSAVERIGNGEYLLVADDKAARLLIVHAEKRKVVGRLRVPFFEDAQDWEAMTKDSDENYYLINSPATHLLRFRLKNESVTDPAKFVIDCMIDLDIKESFDSLKQPLIDPKNRRPEIEGLAVRENGGKKELVVGIREFHSRIIHVALAEIPDNSNKLTLKPFFTFTSTTEDVEWHLSSIEYVPSWKGFLIVTSKEDDNNKCYGNMLRFVSDGDIPPSPADKFRDIIPEEVGGFGPKMKAEGLAILSATGGAKLKVVIVFDNDDNNPYGCGRAKIAFADLSKPIK